MWGMRVRVEREALYEEVWSEPMVRLAKKYTISDVGLKKVCAKMAIPMPARGYWAKSKAGKPIRKTALPKLPEGMCEFAWIGSPRPPFAGEFRQVNPHRMAAERESAGMMVVVPGCIAEPHPLIEGALSRARKKRSRRPGSEPAAAFDIRVSQDQFDRALRIADALAAYSNEFEHLFQSIPNGDSS